MDANLTYKYLVTALRQCRNLTRLCDLRTRSLTRFQQQSESMICLQRTCGTRQIFTKSLARKSLLQREQASSAATSAARKESLEEQQKNRLKQEQVPLADQSNSIQDDGQRDKRITIFLRKSRRVLEFTPADGEKHVSIFLPGSEQLVNISFEDVRTQMDNFLTEEEKKNAMIDPSVRSIDELMWKPMAVDIQKLPQHYLKLSKIRLTGLVVITQMAGYAMAPGVFHAGTFLLCTVGTGLTSASANAINQFFEVPYDSQMNRTKNRVLVRGQLSTLHAVGFATVAGLCGLTILASGVNLLTAGLGALNLGLYTLIYTPMKRISIANTWLGSLVGAIPPMMGWAACTGALEPGAWLLGAILYAWQFPHFNALSWNLRPDYSRAGYRMTSVVNPAMCKRVALRYCVGMVGLCTLAPVVDLTTWTFAVDSLPLNLYMTYLGWKFYREGDSNSSRKLFRFTLVHIPALMVLMLISKKSFKAKSTAQDQDAAQKLVPVSGQ